MQIQVNEEAVPKQSASGAVETITGEPDLVLNALRQWFRDHWVQCAVEAVQKQLINTVPCSIFKEEDLCREAQTVQHSSCCRGSGPMIAGRSGQNTVQKHNKPVYYSTVYGSKL